MATATKKAEASGGKALSIEIRGPSLAEVVVTLEGTEPVETNRMSDWETRKLSGDKVPGEKPGSEYFFQQSIYWRTDPKTGVTMPALPGRMVQAAIIQAVRTVDEITLVLAKQIIRVTATMIPIETYDDAGKRIPHTARHAIELPKNSSSQTVASHRAIYDLPWVIDVPIKFNDEKISRNALLNLIAHAGFGSGFGCFRVGKGGEYGGFEIKGFQPADGDYEAWQRPAKRRNGK